MLHSILLVNKNSWRFKLLFMFVVISSSLLKSCESQIHYNIPDPECTGAFGLCTADDKLRIGREAIAKLHEKMDEDKDGSIEIHETKDVKALNLISAT
jgi:hypothetical protein